MALTMAVRDRKYDASVCRRGTDRAVSIALCEESGTVWPESTECVQDNNYGMGGGPEVPRVAREGGWPEVPRVAQEAEWRPDGPK